MMGLLSRACNTDLQLDRPAQWPFHCSHGLMLITTCNLPVTRWQWHPGGYGGIDVSDAVIVPGLSRALLFDWNGDNAGPYTADEYTQHFQQIEAEFPGAQVLASTFDEFTQYLAPYTSMLPIYDGEIGDTWIYVRAPVCCPVPSTAAGHAVRPKEVGHDPRHEPSVGCLPWQWRRAGLLAHAPCAYTCSWPAGSGVPQRHAAGAEGMRAHVGHWCVLMPRCFVALSRIICADVKSYLSDNSNYSNAYFHNASVLVKPGAFTLRS